MARVIARCLATDLPNAALVILERMRAQAGTVSLLGLSNLVAVTLRALPAALATRDGHFFRGHLHSAAQEILDVYLRRYVKAKPVRERDWSRPMVSCRCPDCEAVNAFLRNPEQSVADLSLDKNRRLHIHRTLDRSDADVTHETDRSGRGDRLLLTKRMREADDKLKAWLKRKATARALFSQLCSQTLRDTLGDDYQEDLFETDLAKRALDRQVARPQRHPLDDQSGNIPRLTTSREERPAKRVRVERVDVVDLT